MRWVIFFAEPDFLVKFSLNVLSRQQRGRQRQVIRVRGRPRSQARAFSPVPVAPLVSSCPEPVGLQLYPDPTTCNRFFKCANGTLTHETCGNGLLFDKSKAFAGSAHNNCAYNWQTDCDQRPAEDNPIASPGCPYQVKFLIC